MKKSSKITFCAMMVALATLFMMFSYFPYLTYAIPAICGLFIMIVIFEINCKWATLAYLASAVLVFLFAESESKLMYIVLFGYYPIIKVQIEKIGNIFLEWILKLLVYVTSVFSAYFVFMNIFGVKLEEFVEIGRMAVSALIIFGALVFVLYDIAIARISIIYFKRIHGKVSKFFK